MSHRIGSISRRSAAGGFFLPHGTWGSRPRLIIFRRSAAHIVSVYIAGGIYGPPAL